MYILYVSNAFFVLEELK